MANKRNLQRKDIERIKELYKSGARPQEVANNVGCSLSTAKAYRNVFKDGCENSTDYFNHLARKEGFKDHKDRYKPSILIWKMNRTEKNTRGEFEGSMVNGGLMYSCGVASNIDITDLRLDLEGALDELASRHYGPRGLIFYGLENPSGAREAKIIKDYYYGGMKTPEIAENLGISPQKVSIILERGLDRLKQILEGKDI